MGVLLGVVWCSHVFGSVDGGNGGLGLSVHLLPLPAAKLAWSYLMLWQRCSNGYCCVNSALGCFQDVESYSSFVAQGI